MINKVSSIVSKDSKPEFDIGSVVRLKSGGPSMTVLSFDGKTKEYECVWFYEGAPYNTFFPYAVVREAIEDV